MACAERRVQAMSASLRQEYEHITMNRRDFLGQLMAGSAALGGAQAAR